jgi:hypothetical protein
MDRIFREWRFPRGKSMVLAMLGPLVLSWIGFLSFSLSPQLPPSAGAPRPGQKAPDFTLPDQDGKLVSLAGLLKPGAGVAGKSGVVLIFYRGYW